MNDQTEGFKRLSLTWRSPPICMYMEAALSPPIVMNSSTIKETRAHLHLYTMYGKDLIKTHASNFHLYTMFCNGRHNIKGRGIYIYIHCIKANSDKPDNGVRGLITRGRQSFPRIPKTRHFEQTTKSNMRGKMAGSSSVVRDVIGRWSGRALSGWRGTIGWHCLQMPSNCDSW